MRYTSSYMMRALILFGLVAAVFANECGENAHFETCGTACPLTCDNYDNPPQFCVLRCDIGCHCDEGYVKTSDGECVRPEECPSRADENRTCGENERYLECGTACPRTCENLFKPPKICPAVCVQGCQCRRGFVRNSDKQCVRPRDCRVKCGKNERFNRCGTDCPLTCENYENPPEACNKMCRIGCECKRGFVRSADGDCVQPNECPAGNQEAPVEKTCLAPPETGVCDAYFPMWYYDVTTESCHKFVYGGCGGNGNRYRSEEECMEHCKDVKMRNTKEKDCESAAESGMCLAYMKRFYYDKETGECKQFIYGGCGGNGNNYRTKDECNKACAA